MVNHQSVLVMMGLWVAVAGGFVMQVWFLKQRSTDVSYGVDLVVVVGLCRR